MADLLNNQNENTEENKVSNESNNEEVKKENESIVSYSEKELQDAIDKAVEEATKGMLTKDKVNEIVKAEKAKEAARAKMTAQEKAEEERKEAQDKLKAAQEELRLIKLENETSKLLEENNVSQKFGRFLMQDDLETTKSNVEEFKKIYDEDIQKAVKEKLKTETPKTGDSSEPLSAWEAAANKIR